MGLLNEDIAFHSNIPVPLDITVAVVYSVFGVCSLFGNSTLLYVSYKKKHILKPAEYFIINLAISDLGLTLSLYPMAITSSFYHRFNSIHGRLLIACAWVYALLFACSPLAHWGEYGPEPYGTACCIDWRLSNQHTTARSYTVALFIFCYILPCCVIIASYTGILITVHTSRKTMERHASRQTHMSSIQTIIIKLSVAVCIGFFLAWSPYAVVSMWAAFGHIENIPPLAFAMPALFAKSSTIYNPIIYLMLRPNFRRVIHRDMSTLCHVCLKSCLCFHGPVKCCSKPKIQVRLHTVHRQTDQFPSSNYSVQPPMVALISHSCEKCKDAECLRLYPAANGDSSRDQDVPDKQTLQSVGHKKSLLATKCAKKTTEIDNLHINLEMVPGHAKVAWP
ncbi:hypothetical protein PAMA_004973 [Pampus argenteus]